MATEIIAGLGDAAAGYISQGVHNIWNWAGASGTVTLASNQYPTKIQIFHNNSAVGGSLYDAESPGKVWNNASGTETTRVANLFLTSSGNASESYRIGQWYTQVHDYPVSTSSGATQVKINRQFDYNGAEATISNGKALAGKTLAIYFTGSLDVIFQYSAKIKITLGTLYSVTPSQTTGGTIKVNNGTSAVYMTAGEQVTLSATPASGYEFVRWNVSPSATISGNTLTVPSSNVTVSATFQLIHTLKWATPNSLTVAQNDYKLTAKLTGHATDTRSHTITYKLYGYNGAGQRIFNETFGAESNNVRTVQIPITDANIGVQYTFKAYAVCSADSAEGPPYTITPKNVHKTVQYRVNGQWVECIPYYRINDRWQEVEPYYRNEGIWIPCSKT